MKTLRFFHADVHLHYQPLAAAPKKKIWAYSGYEIDDILEDELRSALLQEIDILVDGRFVDELKDPALRFRGSSNQRIIDVKKTLAAGEIVLAME